MSSQKTPRTRLNLNSKVVSVGDILTSESGRQYTIREILQKKDGYPLGVYETSHNSSRLILKDVASFEHLQEIYGKVEDCPYVRLPLDTIIERPTFVYKYFTSDFLRTVFEVDLPLATTKRVLKDALRGLAALHEHNVVHTDIKPNNIFLDLNGTDIGTVQLGDIEDAAIVPTGSAIMGRQMGNWMWRSPEAHAAGPIEKPSDIFSFALVVSVQVIELYRNNLPRLITKCVFAVHKRILFAVDDSELPEGVDKLAHVLERQISFFADFDSMQSFLRYIHKSPYLEAFRALRDGFNERNPRRPFAMWTGVDPLLKDLVCKMADMDPDKRITAGEALLHPWFEGI